MARRKLRRSTRMVDGKKRVHIWAKDGSGFVLGAMAVSHRSALAVFESELGSQLLGCTVQVSHLDLMVKQTTSDPADPQTTTMGARIFTENTLSQLTVAHGPVSDPNADWQLYYPVITVGDSGAGAPGAVHHKAQFGSMRTMDELGQGLLLSVENTGVQAVEVRYSVTIGVLLP